MEVDRLIMKSMWSATTAARLRSPSVTPRTRPAALCNSLRKPLWTNAISNG